MNGMGGQDFNQAYSFFDALSGGHAATTIFDFRAIHDTRKDIPALINRCTVQDAWSWIVGLNDQGYGIFAVIAAMDGSGLHLQNVHYLRAHYVDLDEGDAKQQYERTLTAWPAPSFAVQSSPDKFHVYWPCQPYQGNDRFELVQRKLRQTFNGDRTIIDATRVMRVPGTIHAKDPSQPHLVTCWALAGFGQPTTVEQLEQALAAVNVIDGGIGTRHELGDPELAAPSIAWLDRALELADPNAMDRYEWIAITAAVKQSGWSLTDPDTLFAKWSKWCERYTENNPGENAKQWNSIRNSELGWQSLLTRVPTLRAAITFGGVQHSVPGEAQPAVPPMPVDGVSGLPAVNAAPPMPEPQPLDCSGEYLTHLEQQQWFKGCIFITNIGTMLTKYGRFLNATQFNVEYGGKKFIIDTTGKMVNEPWQAATRSTMWTVPKVDHIRFVPANEYGTILTDDLGRTGVNTYRPAIVPRMAGDASPFLNHIAALLPTPGDQRVLLDYLAHNAKYPGHKIPWAPVIQSAEGAGKGVLKLVMSHVMGRSYTYFPKAKDLSDSGAKFNAWMRNKLFILADEIKVDDRADLIEVLKPMISEEVIEVQGKGHDQELEDNFSNWLFFSNWKNAIPVNKNGRRFCIFFSPIQTLDDLLARGMNDYYFKCLYDWLNGDGAAIVADYLLNYPIERGAIPMRAPDTSSTAAAVDLSRGPIERMIGEAVEDGIPGFRGGWISATAVINRVKATNAVRGGNVSGQMVATILEGMGYTGLGRSPRPFFQEDRETRPYLFYMGAGGDVNAYGRAQGWE
jgi:hypothetical protein